jgi:FkbM family methyltransferase
METTISNLPNIIAENSNIKPSTIVEIGSYDGKDAYFLKQHYSLDSENIYCFEADPNNYKNLSTSYPDFNNIHAAVSDENGRMIFQCFDRASAISSIKKRVDWLVGYPHSDGQYTEHEVDMTRMDTFIQKHNIKNIDICKIDVEGCSYEVLEGFGDKLKIVNSIHIEGELKTLYENQKLFKDFEKLLISNNFDMVSYAEFDNGNQCDSVWIKKTLRK